MNLFSVITAEKKYQNILQGARGIIALIVYTPSI